MKNIVMMILERIAIMMMVMMTPAISVIIDDDSPQPPTDQGLALAPAPFKLKYIVKLENNNHQNNKHN